MNPEQQDLYKLANETKDWSLIAKVSFRCGFHADGLWPCQGVISIERGLLEDNESLFECGSCGMLVTGAWATDNLDRIYP